MNVCIPLEAVGAGRGPRLPRRLSRHVERSGNTEAGLHGADGCEIVIVGIGIVEHAIGASSTFAPVRARLPITTQRIAGAGHSVAAIGTICVADALDTLIDRHTDQLAVLPLSAALRAADALRRVDLSRKHAAVAGAFGIGPARLPVGFQIGHRAGCSAEASARAVACNGIWPGAVDAAAAVGAGRGRAGVDVLITALPVETRVVTVAGQRARRCAIGAGTPRAGAGVAGVGVVAAIRSLEAGVGAVTADAHDAVNATAAIEAR